MSEKTGGRILGRLKGKRDVGNPEADANAEAAAAPREVVNDATSYGVQIQPADVAAGAWHWQAVRVHHLTPQENGGNHHIYMDARDPASGGGADGVRVNGARLRITWDGGEQIVTVDKPANEPGANFPMWKWQVCAVTCLGLSGQELPSDRVTGLHTGHPDEAAGNTLFHHSFHVTFVKTKAAERVYTDSVIYGVIHNGAGRTAVLLKDGKEVARKGLGVDEAYRFAGLAAGEYVVMLEGTDLRSATTRMNGRDQVQIDLTLTLKKSAIKGRVRNGAGRTVTLLKNGKEVATRTVAADETFRFIDLPAGAYRVTLAGTNVISGELKVDGVSEATAELIAPAGGKSLQHYVLFGPIDNPRTRAHMLLAQDYLLAFKPVFGFSPAEARAASSVTIVGGPADVSAQTEAELRSEGVTAQRIGGTVAEVAAALSARIASGRAF
jgi:hypothetical protein